MRLAQPIALLLALSAFAVACTDATAPTPEANIEPAPSVVTAPTAATSFEGGLTGATGLGASFDAPVLAPPLTDLVASDGTSFALADLSGPSLVFFGYTHCPDVCPTTIGELFGVLKVEPDSNAVFISVDPERDTPEFLDKWTQYFPDGFVAVTGSPGAIRAAADNYGVKYARVETNSSAGYSMSHTADVFLIDDAGQLLARYPFGTKSDAIIADLAQLPTS